MFCHELLSEAPLNFWLTIALMAVQIPLIFLLWRRTTILALFLLIPIISSYAFLRCDWVLWRWDGWLWPILATGKVSIVFEGVWIAYRDMGPFERREAWASAILLGVALPGALFAAQPAMYPHWSAVRYSVDLALHTGLCGILIGAIVYLEGRAGYLATLLAYFGVPVGVAAYRTSMTEQQIMAVWANLNSVVLAVHLACSLAWLRMALRWRRVGQFIQLSEQASQPVPPPG